MTPAEVFTKILASGGRVIPNLTRPRLLVPRDLKPLALEHRQALRGIVLYRETIRRWWALTAEGPAASVPIVMAVYQDLIRLQDEVGEPTATALRYQWARQWWQDTGRCPWCGDAGAYHGERGA